MAQKESCRKGVIKAISRPSQLKLSVTRSAIIHNQAMPKFTRSLGEIICLMLIVSHRNPRTTKKCSPNKQNRTFTSNKIHSFSYLQIIVVIPQKNIQRAKILIVRYLIMVFHDSQKLRLLWIAEEFVRIFFSSRVETVTYNTVPPD